MCFSLILHLLCSGIISVLTLILLGTKKNNLFVETQIKSQLSQINFLIFDGSLRTCNVLKADFLLSFSRKSMVTFRFARFGSNLTLGKRNHINVSANTQSQITLNILTKISFIKRVCERVKAV